MTAVAHHGPPGSYKTFSIIQRVAIEALKSGRTVVTNVRGFNSLLKVEAAIGEKLPESSSILYVEHSLDGFKAMARFFHWAPAGSLILMDEAQRIFPTRSTFKLSSLDYPGGAEKAEDDDRPATLEAAIDQHRHFNWDIYLTTTNIAKVNKEIRLVLEGAYRHRNVSGVLPWWKDTWKEFPHDAESSGKSTSHYSGDPKRYVADKRIFECYQSTATGVVKQSMESKPIYKDKRLVGFGTIILFAVFGFFYNLQEALSDPVIASNEVVEMVVEKGFKSDSVVHGDNVGVQSSVPTGRSAPRVIKTIDPFPGAKFFVAGSIGDLLILEVEIDEELTSLTSVEFEKIGYYIEKLTDCLVSLNMNGIVRYAVCHPSRPETNDNVSDSYGMSSVAIL